MILQRECICIDFNANYNTLYKYYSISKQNCHFIQACSGFHFTLQNIIIITIIIYIIYIILLLIHKILNYKQNMSLMSCAQGSKGRWSMKSAKRDQYMVMWASDIFKRYGR